LAVPTGTHRQRAGELVLSESAVIVLGIAKCREPASQVVVVEKEILELPQLRQRLWDRAVEAYSAEVQASEIRQ
jgi:hypothetical protein